MRTQQPSLFALSRQACSRPLLSVSSSPIFSSLHAKILADEVATLGNVLANVEIQAKRTENLVRPDAEPIMHSDLESSVATRETEASTAICWRTDATTLERA